MVDWNTCSAEKHQELEKLYGNNSRHRFKSLQLDTETYAYTLKERYPKDLGYSEINILVDGLEEPDIVGTVMVDASGVILLNTFEKTENSLYKIQGNPFDSFGNLFTTSGAIIASNVITTTPLIPPKIKSE